VADAYRLLLFDIDGTLVSTGGAGAVAWRRAFEELHGVPADIGKFTDAGMTDPAVAQLTFKAVLDRDPSPRELATVMAAYLDRLPYEVEHSEGYRVLDGAEDLLRRLGRGGILPQPVDQAVAQTHDRPLGLVDFLA
jgi:beta-phosphoglucomutase-like phosphatase (HAD superfamily)